jgi:hypothetical protein
MPMRSWLLAAFGVAALAVSVPARADTIAFDYTLQSGTTVSGILDGNLQSDANTFDVSGISSFDVNGTAITDPLAVTSVQALIYGVPQNPVITVNGAYIDVFIVDNLSGNVFGMAVGDQLSGYGTYDVAAATVGWGGTGGDETFYAANWDPEVVPEPGTLPLILSVLAILGFAVSARPQAILHERLKAA